MSLAPPATYRARSSARKAVKRVRSYFLLRPRLRIALTRALIVALALGLPVVIWGLFGSGIAAACQASRRKAWLCRLAPYRDINKGPDIDSEGESADDGGRGMMAEAGRTMWETGTGEAWKMARGENVARRAEVRIAYFIQVGADSVEMLPRLFSRVHHADNVYVLHLDAKIVDEEQKKVMDCVAGDAEYRLNMHFLPSEMVTYKGISMVLNTLAGMTLAMRKDPGWDYFINLSGADYPLLGPQAQRKLLARPGVSPGRLNFFSMFPQKEWAPYAKFRVKYQYWDPAVVGYEDEESRLRRMKDFRVNPLEPYRRYEFVKAEAWMILSQPLCDFLLRSEYAKKMLMNHAHVLSAPEHFFANVVWNHPMWRKTLVRDAFRKVVWHHKRHRGGQHPYVLDKTGRDPYEFWVYVQYTRSLFARKFSTPSSLILDRIDVELSGALDPAKNDTASIAHVADLRARFVNRMSQRFDVLTRQAIQLQGDNWLSRL